MNHIKKYTVLLLLMLPMLCFADEWKKTASGLEYKFHIKKLGESPKVGDFITINMLYSTRDSVLFDSKNIPNSLTFPLETPFFKGDIFEAIMMMTKGDSASFRISADSFFLITARAPSLPPFIESGSMLNFEIKLLDFKNKEEKEKADAEYLEKKRKEEEVLLKQYLAENNIDIRPNISGLYYIANQRGPGKMAKAGDMVKVHYTGRFLDGSVFDSSHDRGEPFSFKLGEGQVIKGWDEGIALMREGGTATLIIPSKLAYGSTDRGAIPPYSALVFEVELVEIE